MNTIDKKLPEPLAEELERALSGITYGSIELIVQDSIVTQITIRNIKKTSVSVRQKTSNVKVSTSVKNRISAAGNIQIKLRQ